MPLEYRIDHQKRLVVVQGRDAVTGPELLDYQRTVWSRPELAGYHELADMTGVEQFDSPSPSGVWALASVSATMDPPSGGGKFAIVAPQPIAYGLGRMYEAYRNIESCGCKEVGVFPTLTEALAFLGLSGIEPPADEG